MTPEQKRIAIAEFCGFKRCPEPPALCNQLWEKDGRTYCDCELPDYLNDLNACHEFEKTLETDKAKWEKYAHLVCMTEVTVDGNPSTLFDEWGWYGLLKATAAQKCEAFLFLKTLGSWMD